MWIKDIYKMLFVSLGAVAAGRTIRRSAPPSPAGWGRVRFSSRLKASEGLGRLSRWTWSGAPLSADVIRPRALKWTVPKTLVPHPRLVSEDRGQTERNAPTAGKDVRFFSPNAFRAY